jgi:hypothetical protein
VAFHTGLLIGLGIGFGISLRIGLVIGHSHGGLYDSCSGILVQDSHWVLAAILVYGNQLVFSQHEDIFGRVFA